MRPDEELAILNTIAQALNRSVNLDEALGQTLAEVARLLELETGWVWLLRDGTGESYLAAAQNLPPALTRDPATMAGSCYCLDTFRDGDLGGAANVNVVTCSRLKWLRDGTAGLRYHASIPLYAHGRQLGVLNVASRDWRELSPDELRLLYTIGDMLGIAVERARLFDRSSQLGAVEERNRLAREMHDTLAQELAALTLQLESADALLEAGSDGAAARRSVQEALHMARASLEEVRRSVLDLRAAPLEDKSLPEALAALVANLQGRADLHLEFELRGDPRPLPAQVEIGLYRIAQESIYNVLQHAGATCATVTLTLTPDLIRLSVEDNGRGFDPAQVPPGSFGLIGMNERARLLDGRLLIESTIGEGTYVEVAVGGKQWKDESGKSKVKS